MEFDLGGVMNLTGFSICIAPKCQIAYADSCISDISLPNRSFEFLRIPKRHAKCFSSEKREKRG